MGKPGSTLPPPVTPQWYPKPGVPFKEKRNHHRTERKRPSQPCSGPHLLCDLEQVTLQGLHDATIKWGENIKSTYLSGGFLNLGFVDLQTLCKSSSRPMGPPLSFFFLILITKNDFHKMTLAYLRAMLY